MSTNTILTCVEKIEVHNGTDFVYSEEWENIKNFLFNLKQIKVSPIETIMVALKDDDKLLPVKSDLSKIRDLLLSINSII